MAGTGGVTECGTRLLNDTGFSYEEWKVYMLAYRQNMETLYDNIVEQGGYAWQMFQDTPDIYPNGIREKTEVDFLCMLCIVTKA